MNNRELVALAFRSLEVGFSRGGDKEAVSALQEAFARRIRGYLIDLPSHEEMKDLPEELQQEVKERQREVALIREKREAALQIVPAYSRLVHAYRSYDADMGSPRRIARYLGISATTVLIGAVLGYMVEHGAGVPYATMAGIGLGIIAFFTMVLRTLSTTRQMTHVESAHTAAIERLKGELYAAFEAVDQRSPEGREGLAP
ncbi:MAG: hypothetical protein ACE5G5_06375 [Candidatus Methylomirabilales bacterium]